jgi:hypothetical protein
MTVKRKVTMGITAAILVGNSLIPITPIEARNEHANQGGQGGQGSRGGGGGGENEQAMRAQQDAARHAQEQQVRAQEDNARRQQEESMRQQQQQMRGQQQQSERQQQQEMRREQEQAGKQQQQEMRQQQEQAAKQQQQEMRQQQEQAAKEQQQEMRRQQEQAAKQQQQEMRQQQEAAKEQQQQERNQQRETAREPQQEMRNERNAGMPPGSTAMVHGHQPEESVRIMRPVQPRPITEKPMPLEKAVSMPVLDPNLNAEEREHANAVLHNLQAHLYAVPGSHGPQNYSTVSTNYINNYINNYQTYVNNQPIVINRQNTFCNVVPSWQYPAWYQPQPGWVFANGFNLGNLFRIGLDWLGFGWHPYYGPQPEGFVCASNYVPTPWIYVPAYGLWRVAGEPGYAPEGPPYDYTGPISVEVLEPRHIHVRDAFTGWDNTQVVNVMYLYNAFFYPEYERYGYLNRHGYFIWLNL